MNTNEIIKNSKNLNFHYFIGIHLYVKGALEIAYPKISGSRPKREADKKTGANV